MYSSRKIPSFNLMHAHLYKAEWEFFSQNGFVHLYLGFWTVSDWDTNMTNTFKLISTRVKKKALINKLHRHKTRNQAAEMIKRLLVERKTARLLIYLDHLIMIENHLFCAPKPGFHALYSTIIVEFIFFFSDWK